MTDKNVVHRYRVLKRGIHYGAPRTEELPVGAVVELNNEQALKLVNKIALVEEQEDFEEDIVPVVTKTQDELKAEYSEKVAKIASAFEKLTEDDIASDGVTPLVKSLERELGFDITAEERDDAMALFATDEE